MDAERARALLLGLPHVVETMQWGDNLVFWIANKALGGKMFALIDLGPRAGTTGPVIAFAATRERQAELLEQEGLVPAPYLARAGWVAAQRWSALDARAWAMELEAANQTVWARLPVSVRRRLLAPITQPAAVTRARRSPASGRSPGAAR